MCTHTSCTCLTCMLTISDDGNHEFCMKIWSALWHLTLRFLSYITAFVSSLHLRKTKHVCTVCKWKNICIVQFTDPECLMWIKWERIMPEAKRASRPMVATVRLAKKADRNINCYFTFSLRMCVTQWGLCELRRGIQNSMEAILACHPALSTEWLDWVAK